MRFTLFGKKMKYLIIIIASSLLSALLFVYLFYSQTGFVPNFKDNGSALILSLIIGDFAGFGIWYINHLLRLVWSYKNRIALRILSNVSILSLFGALFIKFLLPVALSYHQSINSSLMAAVDTADLKIQISILGFTIIFIYVLVDFLFFSYKNYMQVKVRTIEQQKEKAELQLEMLQKQLSPHYLFNSLNTISSLMDYDAKGTESYIRNLVKTYQYIIAINQKELVCLQDELNMIKAYQYQLSVRFGDNIKWNFNIDDSFLKHSLPPLSLQVLIENAVKHNIATIKEPIIIQCYTKNMKLIVENNITQSPTNVTSHNIGLNNLQRRYSLLGDDNITIRKQNSFIVELPLISIAWIKLL